MKVQDCIVDVRRRDMGGCVDLAFGFSRRFAAPIYGLLFLFAFPCLVVSWLFFEWSDIPAFWIVLVTNAWNLIDGMDGLAATLGQHGADKVLVADDAALELPTSDGYIAAFAKAAETARTWSSSGSSRARGSRPPSSRRPA